MSMHIYGILSEADIAPEKLLALINERGEGGVAVELTKDCEWTPRFGIDDSLCLSGCDRLRLLEVTLPDGQKGVFHVFWEDGHTPHAVIVDHPDYRSECDFRFLGLRKKGECAEITYASSSCLRSLVNEDGKGKPAGYCLLSFNEKHDGRIWYSSDYGFGVNVRDIRKGRLADYFRPGRKIGPHARYHQAAFWHLTDSGLRLRRIDFRQITAVDPESGL